MIYEPGDRVYVKREREPALLATILSHLKGDWYKVAISGEGPQDVEASRLSPCRVDGAQEYQTRG